VLLAPAVEVDPVERARIRLATFSATTMTIAGVFPVGKSGLILASTTNKLSVPHTF